MQMRDKSSCDLGILTNDSGLLHTGNELQVERGWPIVDAFRTRKSKVENCYLFETTILTRFGSNNIHSSLEGSENCIYQNGNCSLPDGTILVWTPSNEQKCKYSFAEDLSGEYADNRWIGEDLALTFPNDSTIINCGRHLRVSEEGFAALFISHGSSRRRRMLDGFVRSSQLAAHLSYLDYDVSRAVTHAFRFTKSAFCQRIQVLQQYTRNAILTNPTELARNVLNNSLLIAERVTEDIVKIWPCIALDQYSFRPTGSDQCFKFLPIEFKTKSSVQMAFIDPVTLIVQPSSKMAPCSLSRNITIEIGGQLLMVDQNTGNSTAIKTLKMLNPNTPQDQGPQELVPHAFHQNALANLTDTMTHAYFTNLVTNTRMTYRIQSAGTSFIITGTPDWDSVKSELVKDFLGDWSKYWWTFVSLVCVICAADWILKIFGFLSERYLGNGRLGRLLGLGKARPKSETPVIEPPTVTSTRTESPNHTPGDPTGWPPSVSNFEQTPRIPSFDPRRVRINMISLYPVGSQSWGTGYAPRWIKTLQ
jgi:hypothetical protein